MSSWRTVSVFISSTFMDMDAERDLLQNMVMKKLSDELAKYRVQVRPVDLRWGIAVDGHQDSDARNAEILKVCFNEIERCRPFFVFLSGERYGWIPSDEEYLKSLSLVQRGDLNGLPESADGNSITAMEVIYGALRNKEQLEKSLFFFRNADYSRIDPETRPLYVEDDPVKSERVKALKLQIIEMCDKYGCSQNVHIYDAGEWNDEKKIFTGLSDFGDVLYESLLDKIKSELDLSDDAADEKTWYEEEYVANRLFRDSKLRNFLCREEQINEMKTLALSPGNGICAFQAVSGWGKSALMSKLYEELCADSCKKIVLFHSVGITERSYSVLEMLQRFTYEMSSILNRSYTEPVVGADSFAETIYRSYSDCVDEATASGYKVIVLIDDFDNLAPSGEYDHFYFMFNTARYVLTVSEDIRFTPDGLSVTQRKISGLSEEESREILTAVLDETGGKTVDAETMDLLMSIRGVDDFSYRSPLWLILCCDMLLSLDCDDFIIMRKSDSYVNEFIQSFSGNAGDLFAQLLTRVFKYFGQEFTVGVLGLLSVSRSGLRESDLAALIHNWSPLKFAQLRRWLRNVVVEVGEDKQWDIQFKSLKDTLTDIWGDEQTAYLHYILGGYLNSLPDSDYMKISENIFHLMRGNMKQTASCYLSSLPEDHHRSVVSSLVSELKRFPAAVNWIADLVDCRNNEEELVQLCSFLIYSLNDSLKIDSSFELRRTFLHAVAEKIEKKDDLSQPVLFTLISCYHDLGTLYAYADLGNGARHCFGKALEYMDSIDDTFPVVLLRTQIYCRLGEMMIAEKNYEGVESMLNSGVDSCMEVSKEVGTDLVSRYLSDLYLVLANLCKRTGRIQEASEYYRLFSQYVGGAGGYMPDPADQYLVFEHEADVCFESADYEKALELYTKAKDGFAAILSKNSSDASTLHNLVAVHGKLGRVYLHMSEEFRQEAINCFIRMFNKSFELHRLDPSNPEYMQVLATSAFNAAHVQMNNPEFCDLKQVETLLNTSYHFWRQLYERYGSYEYKEKCDQIETIYKICIEHGLIGNAGS